MPAIPDAGDTLIQNIAESRWKDDFTSPHDTLRPPAQFRFPDHVIV